MDVLTSIGILCVALFIAFVAHEGGHLLAGWLAGFRFSFLAVGPMWLYRSAGGPSLTWRWSPASWAPMVGMWPRTADHYEAQAAWYIAGGPLASLVVAVAGYLASEQFDGLRLPLRAIGLGSAFVFVATAQPFVGTGIGVASDGGRLAQFILDRERARDEAAAMAVYGLRKEGVDPDAELVARAARATSVELPKALQPPAG